MRTSSCVIVLATIISPALAQAPTGQQCVDLANTIAAGYTTTFSDHDYRALRYYASCEAKDTSSGAGISIGWSGFSLGGTYSEASKTQACQQSIDKLGISDTEYNRVKVVFSQALPTIDRCLELAKKGWDIKYVAAGTDAVALTVSHGGVTGGVLLNAAVIPPNSLQCTPDLPPMRTPIIPATPFSTICYRTPAVQLVNGVQLKSADDSTIVLNLDEGPLNIPLKGYQSSILLELQKRIDESTVRLQSMLPKPTDFYVKVITSNRQHAEASCNGDDILISAMCTNNNQSQAAVGPRIDDRNGVLVVNCDRYGNVIWNAEGQLICMRHH